MRAFIFLFLLFGGLAFYCIDFYGSASDEEINQASSDHCVKEILKNNLSNKSTPLSNSDITRAKIECEEDKITERQKNLLGN